ncbi:hypothetical protein GCM10027055_16860 [Janibacter alkaliphilus]
MSTIPARPKAMKAARQPKASATAPPIITPSTEPTEAPARNAPAGPAEPVADDRQRDREDRHAEADDAVQGRQAGIEQRPLLLQEREDRRDM